MNKPPHPAYGDPLSGPFWAAARRHELVMQRCRDCERFQFYPRPFCLACQGSDVEWVPVKGTGSIYSMTVVHMAPSPEFTPPYVVAVVELDEGPRLVTNVLADACAIGDRVRVVWQERETAPPLPLFEIAEPDGDGPA